MIIICSGSSGSVDFESADADCVWEKPFPDWRDGTLQRQLADAWAARHAVSKEKGMLAVTKV